MRPNSGASLATRRRFSIVSWPLLLPRPCMKPFLTTCSQQQVSSTLSPRDTRYISPHYKLHPLNLFSLNLGTRSRHFRGLISGCASPGDPEQRRAWTHSKPSGPRWSSPSQPSSSAPRALGDVGAQPQRHTSSFCTGPAVPKA